MNRGFSHHLLTIYYISRRQRSFRYENTVIIATRDLAEFNIGRFWSRYCLYDANSCVTAMLELRSSVSVKEVERTKIRKAVLEERSRDRAQQIHSNQGSGGCRQW